MKTFLSQFSQILPTYLLVGGVRAGLALGFRVSGFGKGFDQQAHPNKPIRMTEAWEVGGRRRTR